MKCEHCEQEHDGAYGSSRFCNAKCARAFSTASRRKEISQKVSESLTGRTKKKHEYVCEKCDATFRRVCRLKKDRRIHCDSCKRKVRRRKNKKELVSIHQVSKRTAAKIVKRAKLSCVMCGWDRTTLDLHHVVPRSKGGTNNHDNLVPLCPNCHRMAHESQYMQEELSARTFDIVLPNWLDYYDV